jgi:SAM-dependent MidA family methyltransferase
MVPREPGDRGRFDAVILGMTFGSKLTGNRTVAIWAALICTFGFVFWLLGGPDSVSTQTAPPRTAKNASEIHREVAIPARAQAAVKDHFMSFLEYHDFVMFHPTLGYYASGRVNFVDDYRTYPMVMAPVFGHMVADQIMGMWSGMLKAGTLAANEAFTIAEFGAGDGTLAESILAYMQTRANTQREWRQLFDQVMYICYDRSPSLNDTQRTRNERFGKRFAAHVADAQNPTATIKPDSFKGVILSNELPDAFSVHKILLSGDGTAEVAFAVPHLPADAWAVALPLLQADVVKAIEADDALVEKTFFSGNDESRLYLTKRSFVSVLEGLSARRDDYEATSNAMQFQEAYVPASEVPAVADHLRRYATAYAAALAKDPRGMVTYVNPGAEGFIQGSARLLKAGYVLTLDYGTTWDGFLSDINYPLFRTYGPAKRESATNGDTSQPYLGPTLNDFTIDVNFSLLAAEGETVGLRPLYYGSQRGLQTGTSVKLDVVPAEREREGNGAEFRSWADAFTKPSVYKLFVQQKEGTDPAYKFADTQPEPLGLVDLATLTPEQRQRATEIAKRLGG